MKNILKPILFCLLLSAAIFSVNYYVDSYASIRITYADIAKMSAATSITIGPDIPLSDRKLKWAYINIMERRDFLLLGSSRSAMFSNEMFDEPGFYNLCLNGGSTVNDYLAEVYLLYVQGKLPEKLQMEISPFIFNANNGETRYLEWEGNDSNMRSILNHEEPDADPVQPLGIQ